MRFIHMADIHFDSPFRVLTDKRDFGTKRRLEQREAFRKAIEYISKEEIPYLFIAGDLYDQNYIRESTIEFINNLFKTIPNTEEELKEYIAKMKYLKEYLNSLDIRTLYFNTNSGTDFEVGLSEYSKWAIGNFTENQDDWFNFPTYEVYTAPDTRFARGKVVIEKPSTFYGQVLKQGELIFEKGKVVEVMADAGKEMFLSDNKKWKEWILKEENKLNQIGEIALVSIDTPLSKLNKTFNNLLLDENTGCHIALGYSLDECISLPDCSKKEEYYFSDCAWHQDVVFGNDSINVECKTSTGKKKILMSNGIWKI